MRGGARFAIEDLARGWGIELPTPGSATGAGASAARPVINPTGDELMRLFTEWGMLAGGHAADGIGWEITCPWQDEHTDRTATGAAYWPGGGFKCHHGHCADRGRADLERWADARVQEESGGAARLSTWNFDRVSGYRPPRTHTGAAGASAGGARAAAAGAPIDFGTGAAGQFFSELVFVASEDRFFSLRTGELLTRAAVDVAWGARLVGALPVVSARTGAREKPSVWFADPDNAGRARVADRLVYWPGEARWFRDRDAGASVWLVNKWVGTERLGLPVRDADVAEWLRLVRWVCSQDGPSCAESLLDWMALVVGAPGVKPGWHVVIQGAQGLGKDMIIQPVRAGVGEANVGTVNAIALHGAFNEYAERRLVVVNELKQTSRGAATGRDQYGALKELTENTTRVLKINQKNMRPYYARNTSAFLATTNDAGAVALEDDDRRFLVVAAGDKDTTAPWPPNEYAALAAWMRDRGGAELCAEWLRDRWDGMPADRRAAQLGRAPSTPGRTAMVAASADPLAAWMRDQIELGAWPDLMTSRDITGAIVSAARAGEIRGVPTPHRWGAVLRSLGGGKTYNGAPIVLRSGEKVRVWATRGHQRFAGATPAQIAAAYVTAAGHAFRDTGGGDAEVIPLAPE